MAIAVTGWGSLIWCPGALKIASRWRADGPLLPIEFARISQDGRLTLVVHPGSDDQRTYWTVSGLGSMDEARANLREREGAQHIDDIHYMTAEGKAAKDVPAEVAKKYGAWLPQHPDVEAAIWTGLPSNWREKRGHKFSPEDAVRYIQELEALKSEAAARVFRAREYVQNTPSQIDTAVRCELRKRGWNNAELSAVLFDTDVAG